QAAARRRKQELERFRDDINRLFERSFASAGTQLRSDDIGPVKETGIPEAGSPVSSDPAEGKKRYHSIRDRLLRPDADEEDDHFVVNPIARQAASLRAY